MITDELIYGVKHMLEAGASVDDVLLLLRERGWSDDEAHEVFHILERDEWLEGLKHEDESLKQGVDEEKEKQEELRRWEEELKQKEAEEKKRAEAEKREAVQRVREEEQKRREHERVLKEEERRLKNEALREEEVRALKEERSLSKRVAEENARLAEVAALRRKERIREERNQLMLERKRLEEEKRAFRKEQESLRRRERARDERAAAPATDDIKHLKSAGPLGVVGDALDISIRHFWNLLFYMVVVGVGYAVLVIPFIVNGARVTIDTSTISASFVSVFSVTSVLIVCCIIFSLVPTSFTISFLERRKGFVSLLHASLKRTLYFASTSIAVLFISLFGSLFFIVPGFFVLILLSLAPFIAVYKNMHPLRALALSAEIVLSRFSFISTRQLLLVLILILSFIPVLLISGVASAVGTFSLSVDILIFFIVISAFLVWTFSSTLFFVAYNTILLKWAHSHVIVFKPKKRTLKLMGYLLSISIGGTLITVPFIMYFLSTL